MLLFLQLYRFYFILVPCLVQTGILPFLLKSFQFISLLSQGGLQVQVASIMGQLKGTVVRLQRRKRRRRQQSDTDLMWAQDRMSNMKSALIRNHRITCRPTHTHKLSQKLARNTYLEPFGSLMPLISVRSLSQCINTRMICLCWPVISWLRSRWWGMHLIIHPTDL